MLKETIQRKWNEAVDKGNATNKELLKKIIFVDTSSEEYDDNWMINFKVNNKVYHLEYDRKGKPMYFCYDLEKETGISLLELEQVMDCYEGEDGLRKDLYELIYTLSPKQKFELLKAGKGINGFNVKSYEYQNGNLEVVLTDPANEKECTICVPLTNAVISVNEFNKRK